MLDYVSASVWTGLTNKRTIWPLSKMFNQSNMQVAQKKNSKLSQQESNLTSTWPTGY